MKIIALERDLPGVNPEDCAPHLRAEAAALWRLMQDGNVREAYFRQDRPSAVLVLECGGTQEAEEILARLPLVEAGLIAFDVLPLVPYPGFSRLFSSTNPAE